MFRKIDTIRDSSLEKDQGGPWAPIGTLSPVRAIERALIITAGVALFALSLFAFMDAQAFAVSAGTPDSPVSYQRSISESMALTTSHGIGSSSANSHSYSRSISESLLVTATYGKGPSSYSRSMSEHASISTEMPSSTLGQQPRVAQAPYSAGSNLRVEERLSPRTLFVNKGDIRVYSAGTTAQQLTPAGIVTLSSKGDVVDLQEIATLGSSESVDPTASSNSDHYAILVLGAGTVLIVAIVWRTGWKSEKRSYHLIARLYRFNTVKARPVVSILLVLILAMSVVASALQQSEQFGTDYRSLSTVVAALNQDTKVIINADVGNYKVKPYVTSNEKGVPADELMGFGWRTSGVLDSSVSGQWNFNVRVSINQLANLLGDVRIRADVYSTDSVGSDVIHHFSATGDNIIPLIGLLEQTVDNSFSFDPGNIDLRNRILVLEYWIVVNTVPVTLVGSPTLAIHTGSDVTRVQLPTSPSSTTYYLTTPRLFSTQLTESFGIRDSTRTAVSKGRGEQLTITESAVATVIQSRGALDQFVLVDTISISLSKTIGDQLTIQDAATRSIMLSRSIDESLLMRDAISISVAIAIREQVALTEVSERAIVGSRSISEQTAIVETVTTISSRSLTEQMAASDTLSRSVVQFVSMTEQLAAQDTTSIANAKGLSEQLILEDTLARAITVSRAISEQLGVADTLTRGIVQSRSVSEQLGIAETTTKTAAKFMVEQLALAESVIVATAGEMFISDQLGATESISITVSKQVAENLVVSDAIMTAGSIAMTEAMAVTDTIARSIVFTRTISDSLTVTDAPSGAPAIFVAIVDSLAIDEDFANISIAFSLSLDQMLVLTQGFATNFEGQFSQADGEGIVIGASVTLVLETAGSVTEALALQDQVSASQTPARILTESMQTRDSLIILITRPPPPPPEAVDDMPELMITETKDVHDVEGLTDPREATKVGGTWNIGALDEDGLQTLLQDIGMTTYDVDLEAASGDIDDLTMILPTFQVNIQDLSDDGAFITPKLSNLPAGMQVIVPINVEASIDENSSLDLLGNMTVSFTAAGNTGDFAMLITILDNNPEEDVAQESLDDLPAFFIDVTIIGDFPPGMTPDNEVFFEEPPEITFTVTEEWAVEQSTERDSNNVPIVSLYLLDESDGSWIDLTDELELPIAAINDVYTYAATLPHFSTYVVTAGVVEDGSGEGSSEDGGSDRRGANQAVRVPNTVTPIASEGKVVIKNIIDSLAINEVLNEPLYQRVIMIHDVSVAVRVADVRSSGLFGAAVATLNFEITNKGDTEEELVLRYWYGSGGGRTYEDEHTVMIGGGESIVQAIELPFRSAGVYDIMIEAVARDQTLVSTDIGIEVPWLAANLFLLVIMTIIVVASSIGYVVYAMRARRAANR